MRVAIVGAGVSGLAAAARLHPRHEITVFEADARLGGHANTVEVEVGGAKFAVDAGFIVFNRGNYPQFSALLDGLGVAAHASNMSFSVAVAANGWEYNATDLNGLFAQRRNLLRPAFWGMLRDVLRFFRHARRFLDEPEDRAGEPTLGDFLQKGGYGRAFVEHHMLPMCASLWSADARRVRELPARFVCRFFDNHGFLQTGGRPPWLTVTGGSRRYVEALAAPFRDRIRLGQGVRSLRRAGDTVELQTAAGTVERFDRVILAVHADLALRLLADAQPLEREILGAIQFQPNDAVLHTDDALMPRRRAAWAAWNFHVGPAGQGDGRAQVTYWMNRLQGFESARPVLLTLNRAQEIRPEHVLGRFQYAHPVFDLAAARAQRRRAEISGRHGLHFCGAYWGYGFHEDGVRSGQAAAQEIEAAA